MPKAKDEETTLTVVDDGKELDELKAAKQADMVV